MSLAALRARGLKERYHIMPEVAKPSTTPVKSLADLTQENAALAARIIALEEPSKVVKMPVEDSKLKAAIASLEKQAVEDLESGNPKANPNLSLSEELGFVPLLTKDQKPAWKTFRDATRRAYSTLHRKLVPQRKAVISRVLRNGNATVSTVHRVRKDSTVSRASIAVSEPAKVRKGKGLKKAKPQQIAAQMPVAGNAIAPAVLA